MNVIIDFSDASISPSLFTHSMTQLLLVKGIMSDTGCGPLVVSKELAIEMLLALPRLELLQISRQMAMWLLGHCMLLLCHSPSPSPPPSLRQYLQLHAHDRSWTYMQHEAARSRGVGAWSMLLALLVAPSEYSFPSQ